MRRLCLLVVTFTAILASAVHAQSGAIRVICEDCRDPLEHPEDYANFAVNQVYGDGAWMTAEQADDFWIYNLDGDRVYVDIDFLMEGIRVFGNEWPLWPTNMLRITLALPNGDVLVVLRSVFMTPLPVPSTPRPDSDGSGNSGGESGNDGVDEPEPGEKDIRDPNDNGEFPETEWCVEC